MTDNSHYLDVKVKPNGNWIVTEVLDCSASIIKSGFCRTQDLAEAAARRFCNIYMDKLEQRRRDEKLTRQFRIEL